MALKEAVIKYLDEIIAETDYYLVDVVVESIFNMAGTRVSVAGFVAAGTALTGLEFNGAPTAISHRWPACPWGGFIPGGVTTFADSDFTTTGDETEVPGFETDLLTPVAVFPVQIAAAFFAVFDSSLPDN